MAQFHTVLVNAVVTDIQKRLGDDVRVFKRVVGHFRAMDNPRRIVSVGTDGMADVYGFLKNGRGVIPFEIECKGPGDKLRADQISWMETCESMGLPHRIADCRKRELLVIVADSAAAWVLSLGSRA